MRKLIAAVVAVVLVLAACEQGPGTQEPEPKSTLEGSWKLIETRATADGEEMELPDHPGLQVWYTFRDGIFEDRQIHTGAAPRRTMGTYFVDELGRRIYVTLKYATGDNRSPYSVQAVLVFGYSLEEEDERLNLRNEGWDDQNRWIVAYYTLQRGTIPS